MSAIAAQLPLFGRASSLLRPARLRDLAVALVALAGSLVLLAHGGFAGVRSGFDPDAARLTPHLGPGELVLLAASALPILGWRRRPAVVFVATMVASTALVVTGCPFDLALGPAVALYLLAVSRTTAQPWTRRTTSLVLGLLAAYLGALAVQREGFPASVAFHVGLLWSACWFAGERTRLRRKYIAELRERARRAERDAEHDRLLATAEERARIARDLHDSAGHAVNVIAVRAGAARLRYAQDPDLALPALEAIETLARQTAEEIDHIVASLRHGRRGIVGSDADGGGAIEAPIGMASLDTLISQHIAAGLEVDLRVSGARPTRSPTADQAAYRILQEALTNAARHGSGGVRVTVDYGTTATEIGVTNPVPPDAASRPGGGHGLVGMHERAALVGGSFHADRTDGTFRLQVRLPHADHHR